MGGVYWGVSVGALGENHTVKANVMKVELVRVALGVMLT